MQSDSKLPPPKEIRTSDGRGRTFVMPGSGAVMSEWSKCFPNGSISKARWEGMTLFLEAADCIQPNLDHGDGLDDLDDASLATRLGELGIRQSKTDTRDMVLAAIRDKMRPHKKGLVAATAGNLK